jgi:hypothetical protein
MARSGNGTEASFVQPRHGIVILIGNDRRVSMPLFGGSEMQESPTTVTPTESRQGPRDVVY